MRHPTNIHDAVHCLDDLAVGRTPDQTLAMTGAHALENLPPEHQSWDVLEAASTLEALARGDVPDRSERGRARAAVLAAIVRRVSRYV